MHSDAYAAGELKHGTISLITDGVPVIALATQKQVYEKTIANAKDCLLYTSRSFPPQSAQVMVIR